jgi:hypothetical protein
MFSQAGSLLCRGFGAALFFLYLPILAPFRPKGIQFFDLSQKISMQTNFCIV